MTDEQRQQAEKLVTMAHGWFKAGRYASRRLDEAALFSALTWLMDDVIHGKAESRTFYKIDEMWAEFQANGEEVSA